ncbi:hypothetical protein POSPLADRAFT_1161714, partial [Postia placenta MAD-698-R-SB12]
NVRVARAKRTRFAVGGFSVLGYTSECVSRRADRVMPPPRSGQDQGAGSFADTCGGDRALTTRGHDIPLADTRVSPRALTRRSPGSGTGLRAALRVRSRMLEGVEALQSVRSRQLADADAGASVCGIDGAMSRDGADGGRSVPGVGHKLGGLSIRCRRIGRCGILEMRRGTMAHCARSSQVTERSRTLDSRFSRCGRSERGDDAHGLPDTAHLRAAGGQPGWMKRGMSDTTTWITGRPARDRRQSRAVASAPARGPRAVADLRIGHVDVEGVDGRGVQDEPLGLEVERRERDVCVRARRARRVGRLAWTRTRLGTLRSCSLFDHEISDGLLPAVTGSKRRIDEERLERRARAWREEW